MRVLIILALAGAAIAHETAFVAHHAPSAAAVFPLAYQTINVLEPRTAFEYSSSVHTADYTNHASVKHDSAGLATRTVAAASPIGIVKSSIPSIVHEQHVVAAIAPAPVHETLIETPVATVVNAESDPSIPAVAIVKEATESAPVAIETSLPVAAEPIVELVKPSLQYTRQYQEPTTFVQVPAHYVSSSVPVHHAIVSEPIVKAVPAAEIAFHQPALVSAAYAPIVEQKIVGETVVAEGILAAEKTQYHSQNILGEATYGHSEPLQTHNAIQDAAGNKAGAFSYVAPDGRVLTTEYVADENGYRAASNAFPIHEHSRRRRSIVSAAYTALPGHSATYRLDSYPTVYSGAYSHHDAIPQYAYTTPTLYQPYGHYTTL